MSNKVQCSKALTMILVSALFVTACTEKREAKLPYGARENVFSIAELDTLEKNQGTLEIETDSNITELSLGESAKAVASSLVAVENAKVPSKIKYMFEELQINGQPNKKYPIAISVDQQFVTAYKVISSKSDLSTLEVQVAQTKEEIKLQKQIQKSGNINVSKSQAAELAKVRNSKARNLLGKSEVLIPIFRFKVQSYGTLERAKNHLDESTATLEMRSSVWSKATHIRINTDIDDRIAMGITTDMDRTFVMDSVNNKILTAGMLKNEFQIPLELDEKARVLTLLDVDTMKVFEISQLGKTQLSDSELNQLKAKTNSSEIRYCSEEMLKLLPAAAHKDCVVVLRYEVPVNYVAPELPKVDVNGKLNAEIKMKDVPANQNVGLVKIAENVQSRKVDPTTGMDPRVTIRISDIKGKEFFYKRTLEDAPEVAPFPPGMAGSLTIVKFELKENRLIVVAADRLINNKTGQNQMDVEEIISLPVKYMKYSSTDASGNKYAVPKLSVTNVNEAEFATIDWTTNSLSNTYSPYSALDESCIRNIGSSQVSDVDMKLEKGSLNFSIDYSVAMASYCVQQYQPTNTYLGTPTYNYTARLKERVSFLVNDKKTDKSFSPNIPFSAQNAMGYGVWTLGKINSNENGLRGYQGQEEHFQVVHDLRAGKKILYTVTGLEPSTNIAPNIRDLYIETTKEVVAAWDLAYRQAFKGTSLERASKYVEVQFAGYNGVEARVGDLDKNIIHYENKFNDTHGVLGVSQVGYNPRSGIVVADSLVVYAGNLQKYVASLQKREKISQTWKERKESLRQEALDQLTKQNGEKVSPTEANKIAQNKSASGVQKVETALQLTKQIAMLTSQAQGKTATGNKVALRDLKLVRNDIANAVRLTKASGDKGFQYASPTNEMGWFDRVVKQLNKNPDMDQFTLEGIVAAELLTAKGNKMSAEDRNQLAYTSKNAEVRTKLHNHFKNSPGCFLSEGPLSTATKFAKGTFEDALKSSLYFDLSHEMGHSQGLTHNFIASFDKANFTNVDGTDSKRNYSSVMDYISPVEFSWDGIGSYDIHALRASHLGLLETAASTPAAPKFIHVNEVKKQFAPNGWNTFNANSLKNSLKKFKYCTDIDVSYEPYCQRFDNGTTAVELVTNMINDYENSYVLNYYAWDRNDFNWANVSRAYSNSMSTMLSMRQFMDELFFKSIYGGADQAEIADLGQASLLAYNFLNQVIRTQDKQVAFMNPERFTAFPYQYIDQSEKVLNGLEITESRALETISIDDRRIDTVGYEVNKMFALSLLTQKGYPHYKYHQNSVLFSYLDFEKYFLGSSPEQSLYVQTISDILLDKLGAVFSNKIVNLSFTGEKATVNASMRAYAAIFSILNLESRTLKDKDNYANLFKVGANLGAGPQDRMSVSPLDAKANSTSKINFWPIDGAVASNNILGDASNKSFLLTNNVSINPLMTKLIYAQLQVLLAGGSSASEAFTTAVKTAKANLTTHLNGLNKSGAIVSAEVVEADPQMSVTGQVDLLELINNQVISVALGYLFQDDSQKSAIAQAAMGLADQIKKIEESMPLAALNSKALNSGLEAVSKVLGAKKETEKLANLGKITAQIVDGSSLEISYSFIIKNLEFLNNLTNMTNPEFNR